MPFVPSDHGVPFCGGGVERREASSCRCQLSAPADTSRHQLKPSVRNAAVDESATHHLQAVPVHSNVLGEHCIRDVHANNIADLGIDCWARELVVHLWQEPETWGMRRFTALVAGLLLRGHTIPFHRAPRSLRWSGRAAHAATAQRSCEAPTVIHSVSQRCGTFEPRTLWFPVKIATHVSASVILSPLLLLQMRGASSYLGNNSGRPSC